MRQLTHFASSLRVPHISIYDFCDTLFASFNCLFQNHVRKIITSRFIFPHLCIICTQHHVVMVVLWVNVRGCVFVSMQEECWRRWQHGTLKCHCSDESASPRQNVCLMSPRESKLTDLYLWLNEWVCLFAMQQFYFKCHARIAYLLMLRNI